MTDEQGTMDEHAELQRCIAVANALTAGLVQARRNDDPATAAGLVDHLWKLGDEGVAMVLIGNLCTLIVTLEHSLAQAHGPLLDRNEVQFDEEANLVTPAMTAASDQMRAAAVDGDYLSFAQAAVDGQLDALRHDMNNPKYDVDLDHVLPAMQLLDQHSVCLVAAEALLRLAR